MELKQSGSPPAVDAPPTGRPHCSQRSAVFSKPTVPHVAVSSSLEPGARRSCNGENQMSVLAALLASPIFTFAAEQQAQSHGTPALQGAKLMELTRKIELKSVEG